MLKWAVNQPRPSYLGAATGKATETETGNATAIEVEASRAGRALNEDYSDLQATPIPTPTIRLKLKRHSLLLSRDKENQLTSTPLPAASACPCACAFPRTPLLRDLSNIMSPLQMQTPPPSQSHSRVRSQLKLKPSTVYASTLPTFEAEYSPSYRPSDTPTNAPIPGPLLALRGMGIPDSYFEKPRYLEQKPLIPVPVPVSVEAKAKAVPAATPAGHHQATLSSSQMGDVTLERMIDAILESTRKPPTKAGALRSRQRLHQRQRLRGGGGQRQRLVSPTATHSPTYRPAFDPASDLCEYWQQPPPLGAASNSPSLNLNLNPNVYEEREVRSPQASKLRSSVSLQLQLRRQLGVRRKRKIATKISSSVRHSAQKLLAAASRSAQKLPQSHAPRSSRHISPDSGHNSTSDCDLEEEPLGGEELEAACQLDDLWMQTELLARDATKRRLSFSLND
ncbi:CG15646 [Drosophila busckii]|uniref:CG15646 n=1 Tax=Drosophila busckii TaxID=30019 RepID=A0A0M4FA69_DROBS|nr:CG15646 [Drosophila busckii]